MDLLEHEGKRLFAAAGLPVLPSATAASVADARAAATRVGLPAVLKAQVRSGGRGKAGGIRVCRTYDEVEEAAVAILAMTIAGRPVECLLVEPAVEIERELYLAIAASRAERGPVLVFSPHGGVDIEQIARDSAEAIVRRAIDPLLGPADYQVRDVVRAAGIGEARTTRNGRTAGGELAALIHALWQLYHDRDATLVEINPLVITKAGELLCLDSKVTIDENALSRQADLGCARVEDPAEAQAREAGFAYVSLDGNIGVIGNGAGLVMSTIDQIAAAGAAAANFCDIGGGAGADVVAQALKLIASSPRVDAILVSIFGGITRGDEVARGLLRALDEAKVEVPIVVRLEGNAAAEGRAVLAGHARDGMTVAGSAAEAVLLVVAAAREGAALSARTGAGG